MAELTERRALLSPFLLEKSLGECFSSRGVGKTHLSLGIAFAVATGGTFLRWTAPEPARVLLVDGEMAATDLQARLRAIALGSERQPADGALKLIAYDLQGESGLPSLAGEEGQKAIEEHLGGVKLLILDNLSCLFDLPENDADEWKQRAQPWLMNLRRRGISVLFMHHAGKGGEQRGTGAREDVLDYVIRLRHPRAHKPGGPARFIVSFEKTRGLYRGEVDPFEAVLETSAEGAAVWTCQTSRDEKKAEAMRLLASGIPAAQVARRLGVHKTTVGRWRKG